MQRALYLELYFRSAIGNCVNDSASLSVIFAHSGTRCEEFRGGEFTQLLDAVAFSSSIVRFPLPFGSHMCDSAAQLLPVSDASKII